MSYSACSAEQAQAILQIVQMLTRSDFAYVLALRDILAERLSKRRALRAKRGEPEAGRLRLVGAWPAPGGAA
jgi:Arc/MetJ family transcription regulator